MNELVPPYDPVHILCTTSLIKPFYVNCFPLASSSASILYSQCPPILKLPLNMTFYLGKYKIFNKTKEEKSPAPICGSPCFEVSEVPQITCLTPLGTQSCLGSANSLRTQLSLPPPPEGESSNLLTALLHLPTSEFPRPTSSALPPTNITACPSLSADLYLGTASPLTEWAQLTPSTKPLLSC